MENGQKHQHDERSFNVKRCQSKLVNNFSTKKWKKCHFTHNLFWRNRRNSLRFPSIWKMKMTASTLFCRRPNWVILQISTDQVLNQVRISINKMSRIRIVWFCQKRSENWSKLISINKMSRLGLMRLPIFFRNNCRSGAQKMGWESNSINKQPLQQGKSRKETF